MACERMAPDLVALLDEERQRQRIVIVELQALREAIPEVSIDRLLKGYWDEELDGTKESWVYLGEFLVVRTNGLPLFLS